MLPTSAGGDAVRIVRRARAGVPFSHSTVSVIGARLIAVLASVALTLFSVPLLPDMQPSGPITLFVVAIELRAIVSIAAVPVTRWGLREGAMVAALEILGIDSATSLTISLCFGAVVLLVSLRGTI